MHGPQRQRHPDRPLQFQVHEVFDPIRHQREDGRRYQRRIVAPGQMPDEDEHPQPGRRDAGEQQDVVDEYRVRVSQQPRHRQNALEEGRVGVRERSHVRVEDVAVEQVRGAAREAVGQPLEPPHAEKRVAVQCDLRPEIQRLRPGQDHGEGAYEQDRAEQRALQDCSNSRTQHRRVRPAIKVSPDTRRNSLESPSSPLISSLPLATCTLRP